MANSHNSSQGTFSIATPAINSIITMSDPTYMIPPSDQAYQQDLSQNYVADFRKPNQSTQGEEEAIEAAPNSGQFDGNKLQQDDQSSKLNKKRNKVTKKSTKLDAKSKLEKSRQSARECRARKKLRYQYLEDLVCNREKAVIKLREELSTFCKLSTQLDSGSISEADRNLLTDQTKENTST